MNEKVKIRVHGAATLPTLVYLPGLHGDWTLVSAFRAAMGGHCRFVEFCYPLGTAASITSIAAEILHHLRSHGIHEAWLLGESFGSQPAWEIIRQTAGPAPAFKPLGLILAGGFVRHPLPWGVRLFCRLSNHMPMWALKFLCWLYLKYAAVRHPDVSERMANIRQFALNRCTVADRQAITHRYGLIAANDPCAQARKTTLPVYYLAGLFDPLVPWPFVRRWLRRNCPGYRGGKTFWLADHSVLISAPKEAAEQVLHWMQATPLTSLPASQSLPR